MFNNPQGGQNQGQQGQQSQGQGQSSSMFGGSQAGTGNTGLFGNKCNS